MWMSQALNASLAKAHLMRTIRQQDGLAAVAVALRD